MVPAGQPQQGNAYAQFFLTGRTTPAARVMLSVTRLLHHLSNIFQENSMPATSPGVCKSTASACCSSGRSVSPWGHKADDHPEQGWGGMSMWDVTPQKLRRYNKISGLPRGAGGRANDQLMLKSIEVA